MEIKGLVKVEGSVLYEALLNYHQYKRKHIKAQIFASSKIDEIRQPKKWWQHIPFTSKKDYFPEWAQFYKDSAGFSWEEGSWWFSEYTNQTIIDYKSLYDLFNGDGEYYITPSQMKFIKQFSK